MSSHTDASPADRRVRDQARDALVLMAFSAALSSAFAAGLVVVFSLGH